MMIDYILMELYTTEGKKQALYPMVGKNTTFNTSSQTNALKLFNGSAWTAIGSGGGSGGKNYFTGGDFESGISIVSVYEDTASYVDGTGGSPTTISIASNSTTPLEAAADLKITKAASDGSAEGVTILSGTIDKADRGRNLFVSFEWDGTDANYTSADLELKAYDVGGSTILPVVQRSNPGQI